MAHTVFTTYIRTVSVHGLHIRVVRSLKIQYLLFSFLKYVLFILVELIVQCRNCSKIFAVNDLFPGKLVVFIIYSYCVRIVAVWWPFTSRKVALSWAKRIYQFPFKLLQLCRLQDLSYIYNSTRTFCRIFHLKIASSTATVIMTYFF